MKKTALLTAALVVLATTASAVTIKGSKHDLSSGTGGASVKSTNTGEVCIFCHTPHNPSRNVPLWNRTNPDAGDFTMYRNAGTLTAPAQASAFTADSISLFCMSCHDGVTGLGAMTNTNTSNGLDDSLKTTPLGAANTANLGLDLSDDHPVGFNYNTAQGLDTGLKAIGTANGTLGGSAFFGVDGELIECASCHKVHDPGTAGAGTSPFLRISNTGSALCLACHDK